MGEMNILEKLEKKAIASDDLAKKVVKDSKLLPEIFEGISSKNPRVKYSCAKILRTVSEEKPESLYPEMDFLLNF